ncbi:MAG TPA: 30S ribosomal protein S6 [Terriglobales bacterium]|nr:30S ribosomal protein S6 [Terriglobales bacterium]
MNRTYEVMFIVRPDMADEDLEKLNSALENHTTGAGAAVKHIEKMGKRRLAYLVRGFHEGIYVLFIVEGKGEVVHELERRLRVTEPVIKFITVRVDEEHKRLEKMKKLRESRRRGQGTHAATLGAEAPVATAGEPTATPAAPATT